MRVTVRVRTLASRLSRRPPTSHADYLLALVFNVPDGWPPNVVAERTFEALNVDDHPGFGSLTAKSIRYYHARYPSLSVGDLVTVGYTTLVCDLVGFKPLATTDPAEIAAETNDDSDDTSCERPGNVMRLDNIPDDNPDADTEKAIEKANDFAAWRAGQREGNR